MVRDPRVEQSDEWAAGSSVRMGQKVRGVGELRIGYVPLVDAAPLIAAVDLGFFEEEGLKVVLERQLGWGNVRDKLISGHLDAAHSLLGLPVSGALGPKSLDRTVAIMGLGTGGVAVTVSKALVSAGVVDGASLARWMSRRRGGNAIGRPVFGHVFPASVHHYLLRRWLAESDVDPDRDVDLCVLPPPQVAGQMEKGLLAGFCAGEPWNTLAQSRGYGRVTVVGQELVQGHPDKVLAVRREWLEANSETAVRLIRAVIRGCLFCEGGANRGRVVEMLARPDRIDVSAEVMDASLRLDAGAIGVRARNTASAALYPGKGFAGWLLGEMRRWGHVLPGTDITVVSAKVMRCEFYRQAAKDLGIECPVRDDVGEMPQDSGPVSPYTRAGTGSKSVRI